MKLSEVLSAAGIKPVQMSGDVEVTGLSSDSRQVTLGDAFVCMPSRNTDTHQLIPDAINRGAVAIVSHRPVEHVSAPWVQLRHDPASWEPIWSPDHRHEFLKDLGLFCRAFYGDPTRTMRVIGVTGTNGKTTVAWLLRQALANSGRRAAYLGTLGSVSPSGSKELGNTTLFPVELWRELSELHNSGVEDVVMEVSSHALAQHRVEGVRFDLGILTNLSQDHLDFHQSMDQYAAAKAMLFTEYAKESDKNFMGVLNEDDAHGLAWSQEFLTRDTRAASSAMASPIGALIAYATITGTYEPRVFTFGETTGNLRVRTLSLGLSRIDLEANLGAETVPFSVPIGGNFNAENIRATLATLICLGYRLSAACAALANVEAVPGRFESITSNGQVTVIVDYAHTPDALHKLLEGVRSLTMGRVISVFGCGGDRDRGKRPLMARISGELAAHTILTLDNPRTEDPAQIFRDLESGLSSGAVWERVEDRREAITKAVAMARLGDAVVISGKGHETYQMFGREKVHFDDREVARAALESRS